ncbi:unnamed protein product, partial [Rotaria socialis]
VAVKEEQLLQAPITLATPDIVEEITKDDQQPSFKEPTAEAADHAYTEVLTEAVR